VQAVIKAGAQGLMQLMPATAAEMSIRNPFDPGQNIAGGTQYLNRLMKLFDNDLDLVFAGYNAGTGNVKKYGGIPPFKET
jgi:soluble lytic murein transglycosylase-like protein